MAASVSVVVCDDSDCADVECVENDKMPTPPIDLLQNQLTQSRATQQKKRNPNSPLANSRMMLSRDAKETCGLLRTIFKIICIFLSLACYEIKFFHVAYPSRMLCIAGCNTSFFSIWRNFFLALICK